MYRLDEGLRNLIETGLKQGHLTFFQVNSFLPDEAEDPLQLDNLIMCLEEMNLKLVPDPVVEEPEDPATRKKHGLKFVWKTPVAERKTRSGCTFRRWVRFRC